MMFLLFSLTLIIGSSKVPISQTPINHKPAAFQESGLHSEQFAHGNTREAISADMRSLSDSKQALQTKEAIDGKDGLPILIGPVTAEMIIKHRPGFFDAYEKVRIDTELIKRWEAIETPCTIVVVFGSWCGDSQRWLPDVIKLTETPNPFVSVYWIGTKRNKTTKKRAWPPQSIRQKTKRVPTLWLFAPVPGGKIKLVGSIVENPPKTDQTMAEALLELLEQI
jgi:hypothetical protein